MRFRHGGKVATVITELSLALSPFLRRAAPKKKNPDEDFATFRQNTGRTSDNCLKVSQREETDGTLAATGDPFLIKNM